MAESLELSPHHVLESRIRTLARFSSRYTYRVATTGLAWLRCPGHRNRQNYGVQGSIPLLAGGGGSLLAQQPCKGTYKACRRSLNFEELDISLSLPLFFFPPTNTSQHSVDNAVPTRRRKRRRSRHATYLWRLHLSIHLFFLMAHDVGRERLCIPRRTQLMAQPGDDEAHKSHPRSGGCRCTTFPASTRLSLMGQKHTPVGFLGEAACVGTMQPGAFPPTMVRSLSSSLLFSPPLSSSLLSLPLSLPPSCGYGENSVDKLALSTLLLSTCLLLFSPSDSRTTWCAVRRTWVLEPPGMFDSQLCYLQAVRAWPDICPLLTSFSTSGAQL